MKSIELIPSPALLNLYSIEGKTAIVIDVFRASTLICAMFSNGVKAVYPVSDLDKAQEMKSKGFLLAAERKGLKLPFADFDNSPFSFQTDQVKDKNIVYSTLNGTNTINQVRNAKHILIASFLNRKAVLEKLIELNNDLVIVCSGWLGKFCLEDTLLAGNLAKELLLCKKFQANCDAVTMAIELWENSEERLMDSIEKTTQRKRLRKIGISDQIIQYCFQLDLFNFVPVFDGEKIVLS